MSSHFLLGRVVVFGHHRPLCLHFVVVDTQTNGRAFSRIGFFCDLSFRFRPSRCSLAPANNAATID